MGDGAPALNACKENGPDPYPFVQTGDASFGNALATVLILFQRRSAYFSNIWSKHFAIWGVQISRDRSNYTTSDTGPKQCQFSKGQVNPINMSTSDSSLYWACFRGDKRLVLTFIRHGNVNYVHPASGDTPLHQACRQDWLDIVKILIEEYSCNPNVTRRSNQSVLHYACQYGDIDIVEYLIDEQHLDPLLRDNNQLEPLDYALINDKTAIAVYLCKHCISSDEMLNPNRIKTTIYLIKYILRKTSQPASKWKSANGDNILQLMGSSISHIPSIIVLAILNSGNGKYISVFKPDCKTSDGYNLLELTCQSEMYLSQTPSGLILKWLGDATVNQVQKSIPDSKTLDGDTLVQLICQSEICISHVSTVVLSKWLRDTTLIQNLAKNITPEWKTADGNTLLELVCQSKTIVSRISSTVLTKWLNDFTTTLDVMKINFTPDLRTADGVTLFQLICQSEKCLIQISSTVFLKWLRKNPLILVSIFIPDCKTADGDTLLQLILHSEVSISKTTSTVLSNLLSDSREISVDQMKMVHSNWNTLDGSHLLHALCQSNVEDTKIIELMQHYMLNHGLNPDTFLDGEGNTVLHIACQANKFAVVSYLINQAHCDPNIKNEIGNLPLDMTTNPKVIDYLCQHDYFAVSSKNIIEWMNNFRSVDDTTMLCILKSLVDNHRYKTKDGSTLLHVLCMHTFVRSNIIRFVDFLLSECQCDPNCLDSIGKMPLQVTSNSKIMTILIEHGAKVTADVVFKLITSSEIDSKIINEILTLSLRKQAILWNPNELNSNGYTALHLACIADNPSTVNILLSEANCDPNSLDGNGKTALQVTSNSKIMTMLIEHGAKVTADVIFKLITSSEIDSKIILSLSIRKQAILWNPNELNSNGYTALHLACIADNPSTVNILLSEAHCDPNCLDGNGKTALQVTSNSKIMTMLIEHGAKVTADVVFKLITSSEIDSKIINEILSLSIRKQAMLWNPNELNSNGYTALHLACKAYNPTGVNVLLSEAHCDPNCLDGKEKTPLQVTSNSKIMTILIEHGAKVTADVVFKLIMSNKTDSIINEILTLSIRKQVMLWNPNELSIDGYTALHLACKANKLAVVSYLINQAHCDPNIRNKMGSLPLDMTTNPKVIDCLCQHNDVEVYSETIVKWMKNLETFDDATILHVLKSLADNHGYKTKDGSTLLHVLCMHSFVRANMEKFVDFLLTECHCDPNCLDSNGQMPLQVTSDSKIMTKLIEHGAKMTADDVFELIITNEIDSKITEVLSLPIRKQAMLWNPNELNSNGYTALHLACKAGNPSLVNLLLSEAHCDPNFKSINEDVPLQMTTNTEIIKNLIRHGAKTSIMYESHRKHLGTDKPVQPPVKVFIVGNPSVGKSTLTAALKKKVGVIARIFSGRVSGVDRKTVGIVPHDLENKIFGRVTLYDFAGHREFYSGHAALLQTAIQSTPPIFLLVTNLCEDKSEIVKNILYWISFLENQCASVSCKPHIILVGSHADTLRGVNPKDKIKTIIDSLDAKCFINMVYIDFVAMNCQYHESTGMSDLRRLLIKSCEELRIHEPITFNAHCFLVFLIDTFMNLTAVTIKIVSENIEYQQSKEGVLEFLPRNIEALYKICLELNDRGHILLLKDRIAIENSYIVIDKEFLLSEISGTVFAPEGFKQYKELSSNTGVVPLSKIVKSFPDKDINVLIGYLTHLEFCHEISDQALLQHISKDYSRTSENEHYYLFPGLISLEAETNMWQTESHFSLHFGWILQCTKLAQFFTSRFLQVLLLRLAFSLALESKCDDDDIIGIHRKCSIWKNGIFWGREFGMETLVEVIEDKSVIVMARFQMSNLEKCIKHRSEVIHTVLECLDRFCPRVSTTESFIDASSPLKFPFALNSDRTLCTVQDLAQAMVGNCVSPSVVLSGCGKTVPAERFLSFEPYTEIEPLVLQELWDVNNEDKIISDNFLSKFVRKSSSSKLNWFTKIFNNSANIPSNKDELFHELCKWRGSEMIYKHFHQKLDQYSVFAQRNVLVSISDYRRILRNTLIHCHLN